MRKKKNPAGNIKWHRARTVLILIIETVMCLLKSHHLPGGLSLKPAKILHPSDVRIYFCFQKAHRSLVTRVLFGWVLQTASRFTFLFKKSNDDEGYYLSAASSFGDTKMLIITALMRRSKRLLAPRLL